MCYLDATEWSIGKFKLHCLVLAVHYQGIAIPIYFKLYNHKGVLSEKERINFIDSASSFCKLTNSVIVADREFIGDTCGAARAVFTLLQPVSEFCN